MASRSAVADILEVDGESGRGAPLLSGAPDPDLGALGYCVHTGTVALYPHGFLIRPPIPKQATDPETGLGIRTGEEDPIGAKRGRITTFSAAARRRLREDLLTKHVPDRNVYDVTLTIQSDCIGDITPEVWDLAKRRLFKRWERAGFGVKWRIELQRKNQTPHLHCCVWTPSDMEASRRNELLYWAWIECLPEEKRYLPGVLDRAVKVKGPYTDIEQSPKWLAYVAGHSSKHKKEQLGWLGKQWGTVNRALFRERPPLLEMELTFREEIYLKRMVSRYLFAKSREHRKKLIARGVKAKGRIRRIFFQRGCRAMRIMPPQVVKRIAEQMMVRRAFHAALSLGPV